MCFRAIHICTILLIASCAASPTRSSQEATDKHQSMSLYLGQRSLGKSDWSPVEDQTTIGIEYSNENPDSWAGWEIGLMGSEEKDGNVRGRTGEAYAGIRKSFAAGGDLRPYVAGGLSVIDAEAKVSSNKDDDASPALYLHGGVAYNVTDAFFIGLDLRVLAGSDIDIAGVDGDADYVQLALVLGFGF